MKHQVHVAIQIVPLSKERPYPIIDKAIEVIEKSGIPYRVGAMETVMQGNYDAIMKTIREAQEACLNNGADEIVVTMKVHAKQNAPVTWEEKGI
jgi:uncharacterized protein YqgV (UPF0045/DUF77 family)